MARLTDLHTRYQAYLAAEAQKISEALNNCQRLLVPSSAPASQSNASLGR